ncbi:hypothetical protein HDC92_000541 [Pedobacter sp. AK017]|uniref:outer membrane beta-barrel protein n=1 Tax=Pedobacter sp. AK017 TaxID=2723073 RepID=UPI00161AD818|nr:outer membrane beta-barrel protein [Pedobacter sp. AK017]MBB5436877.1 hypothetical protein [Pedobacter sp. AK017]
MKYSNQVNAAQLYTSPPYIRYFNLMIRISILFFFLLFSTVKLFAQNQPTQNTPPPLPVREISGIVKDSTDLGVIGATVSLTSIKDTLKTSTNSDGIFVFKNVKSATYTILVQSIGYRPSAPMRYKQNDAIPRIVMDPILLKEQKNTLNEVVISGTPSITYKTDTVEYKASDYIVRANSTVDELLKKMEGMEVGNDGSLVHQGQNVTKAKLNGKEYQGGDIATAIKNLPAEIVDKIQIVDDYGDQAARTGIKDGDPEKVLNITTRTDKSVGNMANIFVGAGNNDRYEAGIFGTRINGNQTIGVNGRFSNTVNGVASSGDNSNNSGGGGGGGGGRGGQGGQNTQNSGGSGSGGTTTSGRGSFSIRDKIGKKIELNLNYDYTSSNVKSLNDSYSVSPTRQRIQVIENGVPIMKDTTYYTFANSLSNGENLNKSHNFRAEIEINLDSNNFLRAVPTLRYSSANNTRFSDIKQTGFYHQNRKGTNISKNTRPQLGASVFYQHIFKKPRRNLSLQVDANSNNLDQEQEQDTKIIYFLNEAETETRDSAVNRIVARKNLQSNYRGSFTFAEPLTANTQLELNAQVNYNGYDNTATTQNIINGNPSGIIDSLSNIYDYSFTQGRIALNYRYGLSNMSKVRFSLGITAIPSLLSGTKVSLGTTTNRSSFNMVPIARFEYLWSRQHKMSINYYGNAIEPTFDQIQPVRDVTNPQNPIVGNPNLVASFQHTVRAGYDNYIANSKLNYSLNVNGSLTDNSVIRNNVQIIDQILTNQATSKKDTIYITETRFLNTSGAYKVNGNYSISKQLNDRRYNLSLSGSASYDHRISMSASQKNINTVMTFIERFGPRINPNDWFEINPNVSYNYTKSTNTLPGFRDTKTNTLALNLDGRMYFLNSWLFGYSASKNYVSGIDANVTSNPFVVNAYIEKEFFNRRGRVTFQAFDILNQNNFVSRDNSEDGGYTDTKSNALSRYFMLRLSMRLQKWTGAQGRGGRQIMRRGDGSFM